MKKNKLLLTTFMFVASMALCMGNDTVYKLKIINNSQETENFCLYQIYPEQDSTSSISSLAWWCHSTYSERHLAFSWSADYSMIWSETGILASDVNFSASGASPANPSDVRNNFRTLSYSDGACLFINDWEGEKNMLTIETDGSIFNKKVSIGVGMIGNPAISIIAEADKSYKITANPTYWLVVGDFEEGEVLDVNAIKNDSKQIIFGSNIYEESFIYLGNNKWE